MKRHFNEDSDRDLLSSALFSKRLKIDDGDPIYVKTLCDRQQSISICGKTSSTLEVPIVDDYSCAINSESFLSGGLTHDDLSYCHDMTTSSPVRYGASTGRVQLDEHSDRLLADSNFNTSNSILRELRNQREGRRGLKKDTLPVSDTCSSGQHNGIAEIESNSLKFVNKSLDFSFAAVSNQQKFRQEYERRLSTEDRKSGNTTATLSIDASDDFANKKNTRGQRSNSFASGLADGGASSGPASVGLYSHIVINDCDDHHEMEVD